MKKEELLRAINQCEDKYVNEVLTEKENKIHQKKSLLTWGRKGTRVAAAVFFGVCICGASVVTAATVSDGFHDWLTGIFGEQKVTEVQLEPPMVTEKPDIMADQDNAFMMKTDTQIYGEKESFVCECHDEGIEEKVDKVYTILENGLREKEISTFQGEYDGVPFSFQYVIENNEICGFNCRGDIEEIFPVVKDEEIIYAALIHLNKKDTSKIDKGCIASLNLKTGEVKKLSNDKMICNFMMSPNGKVLLCNHRADAYWSVFDLENEKERKVKDIDGYNRTKEIHFLDDYHILTLGKPILDGDTEWYGTYEIDLHSKEIVKKYEDYGDINVEWSYRQDKNMLKIYRITNGDTIEIGSVPTSVHIMTSRGDYALFGNLEESAPYYLVNLKKGSYKEIEMPEGIPENVEIYLASAKDKILVRGGSKAYLVDVSEM